MPIEHNNIIYITFLWNKYISRYYFSLVEFGFLYFLFTDTTYNLSGLVKSLTRMIRIVFLAFPSLTTVWVDFKGVYFYRDLLHFISFQCLWTLQELVSVEDRPLKNTPHLLVEWKWRRFFTVLLLRRTCKKTIS